MQFRRITSKVRITNENMKMLHRIQEAQPVYSHVAWEESWRRSERHLRTACVYPVPACFFLFAGTHG